MIANLEGTVAEPRAKGHYGRGGYPPELQEQIIALYAEHRSTYKVAAILGRSGTQIRSWLKRRGLTNAKKRNPQFVLHKGEKFTPDHRGYYRSTTFASRQRGQTRLLHRVVWEEAHGKIKRRERKTHQFIFRDGNRANCALSNLIFVSRKEAANFRGWNGNAFTKWEEAKKALRNQIQQRERCGNDATALKSEYAELLLARPSNGDPKRRRRQMLYGWKKRTPERRAEIFAAMQAGKQARRRARYERLPEYAIALLPAEEREAVERHMRDGENTPALARSLGVCEKTVRRRVRRGLARLPEIERTIAERVASVEKWIVKEAYKWGPIYGVSPEDMAQESRKAAFKAAQSFDASLGYKFLTYATRPIRGAIIRCGRAGLTVHVPDQKYKTHRTFSVSYDAPIETDSGAGESWGEIHLGEESKVEASADDGERALALRKAIAQLPEREREVIERRFFGDETLEEIAVGFGLTRERIRQIELKAKHRLGRALAHLDRVEIDEEPAA